MSAKRAKPKVIELTPNDSAKLLGITYSTFYLWRKDSKKQLPKPIVYNPRKIMFIKSELEEWLKNNQPKRGEF